MAKLSCVIRSQKVNKEGLCNVQIAVSSQGKTAYISLPIKVSPKHFVGGIIVKEPNAVVNNAKIAEIMETYQKRLDKIMRPDVYTVTQLKDILLEQTVASQHLTLQEWCETVCSKLEKQGKNGNAYAIRRSVTWFCKWRKGDVVMSDITPKMLRDYRDWLPTATKEVKKRVLVGQTEWGQNVYEMRTETVKALKDGSYSSILSGLRNLINRAIADRVVKFEDGSPTLHMSVPTCPVNDVSIPVDSMHKLMRYVPSSPGRGAIRDFCMISFYLGGVNLVDLLGNKFDLASDRFSYVRQKTQGRTETEKVITVPLFPRVKKLLELYVNESGYIDIHGYFDYTSISSLKSWINRRLKRIAVECGIEERLCFNSMRKSFGQYALMRKVDIMTINYVLGHSSGSLPRGLQIMRYYAQAEFELAFDCMDRVFEYVDDPEKYQNEINERMKEKLTYNN